MGIITDNLGYIIIVLGILIGVIGGLATSFKDWTDQSLMCYRNAWVQSINRLLLVIACLLCLLVDFPEARDTGMEWVFFYGVVFPNFCMYWALSFWAVIALKSVTSWVFSSLYKH